MPESMKNLLLQAFIEGATALHFSGGRDSTAALLLCADYWEKIKIYHLDAGDQFPELTQHVNEIEARFNLKIHRVKSDSVQIRHKHGMPSDLLAQTNHPLGRLVYGDEILMQDRYECCFKSVMLPMHERMIEDGIATIIRGVRKVDYQTMPYLANQRVNGMAVLHPISDWSDDDVNEFLISHGVKPLPFYSEGLNTAPECMTCQAWWDDNRMQYLQRHYPDKAAQLRGDLLKMRPIFMKQIKLLDTELNGSGLEISP